jgi:hypothetical protein
MKPGKPPAFHEGHAAPLIQILAWLFLSFSLSAVVAQLATKKAMSIRFVAADLILLTAFVSPSKKARIIPSTTDTVPIDAGRRTNGDLFEPCWTSYWQWTSWSTRRNNPQCMEGSRTPSKARAEH